MSVRTRPVVDFGLSQLQEERQHGHYEIYITFEAIYTTLLQDRQGIIHLWFRGRMISSSLA